MKRMVKVIMIIMIILLIIVLAWNGIIRKTFFPELEAEHLIHKYYEAIIDENYDKAYTYLYIYDRKYIEKIGSINAGTSLTEEEAKQFYQRKIAFLKLQDYQVKDYRIVEVEYEDGHSFWHHLEIDVDIDGKTHNIEEIAFLKNGRLMIGNYDDPFAMYRDGEMNIMIGNVE